MATSSLQITMTRFGRLVQGLSLSKLTRGDGSAAQAFQQMNDIFIQEPNIVSMYWGHDVHDESVVIGTMVWNSLEAHNTFVGTKAHEFLRLAKQEKLFDDSDKQSIVVRSEPNGVTGAPSSAFTEHILVRLPVPTNQQAKGETMQAMMELAAAAEEHGRSLWSKLTWCVPATSPVDAHKEGSYVKTLHHATGWPSVEDHECWKLSKEYKSAAESLTLLKEKWALEVVPILGKPAIVARHHKFK